MFVHRLSILFMSFDNISEAETGNRDFAIYIEVGELICNEDHLNDFYMMGTLVLYRLVQHKILTIKIEMERKTL